MENRRHNENNKQGKALKPESVLKVGCFELSYLDAGPTGASPTVRILITLKITVDFF